MLGKGAPPPAKSKPTLPPKSTGQSKVRSQPPVFLPPKAGPPPRSRGPPPKAGQLSPKARQSPPPKAQSSPKAQSPSKLVGQPPPPKAQLSPKVQSPPKLVGQPPPFTAPKVGQLPPKARPKEKTEEKNDEKKMSAPGPTRYRGITKNDDSDDDLETQKRKPSPLKSIKNVDDMKSGVAGLGPLEPDDDAIFESYLMKRIGVGGPSTHYWEIRFFRLEKTVKNQHSLRWWTSHFQDNSRGKVLITPGVTTCMSFERDAYDEGRRRNLFGIQEKVKGSPVVLDAPNTIMKNKWLEIFGSLGVANKGEIPAEKTNSQSIKEGWIVKQGAVIGTWHRRFFVLLPNMAMYYKWKRDKRPAGVIALSSSSKISVAPASKGNFCLSLRPGGGDPREYFVRCYDSDALQSWLKAFEKAMGNIK